MQSRNKFPQAHFQRLLINLKLDKVALSRFNPDLR